jgi:hypothetical protein
MFKLETARAAIANVKSLHPDFHAPILASLADAGFFDRPIDGGVNAAPGHVSKIRAAMDDPAKVGSARFALGVLGRLGLDADDLDVRKLDVAMAQRGMTTDDRIALLFHWIWICASKHRASEFC